MADGKRQKETVVDSRSNPEQKEREKVGGSLWHTVLSFRCGILGKKPSKWMCIAVCEPLQSYLSILGFETKQVDGYVLDADGDGRSHRWLKLSDGRIIDPTADQFTKPSGEPMPKVYIGELPEWYEVGS